MSGFRIDSGHVWCTSSAIDIVDAAAAIVVAVDRNGYVASTIGSCSLIGFSIDLGSMMNCAQRQRPFVTDPEINANHTPQKKPSQNGTHENIVLDAYQMAAAQIRRRQRRHVQLLVQPLVAAARPDFAARNHRQLAAFLLHLAAARQILNRFGERRPGGAQRDIAAVVHAGGDANRFARHVAAAVEGDTAAHQAAADAADAQAVFDIAAERLLCAEREGGQDEFGCGD